MAAMSNPTIWYVGSTKWSAVTAWATGAKAAGALVRQNATPTVGNERVWVCIVAGTASGSEPSWTLTKGSKTTDNTVTWMEVTGQPATNGDSTNTPTWDAAAKSNTVALGQIVKRASGGSYQICTTAGTAGSGSEPSFSDTAGVTTSDNTVTWTSLGAPGNFAAYAAPHARISNALSTSWGGVAGNTIYVSNNHAETQSTAIAATSIGTPSALLKIICVDDSSAPPTSTATTATVTTTGNSAINVHGANAYIQGITYTSGSGASGGANMNISHNTLYAENCVFAVATTSSTPSINVDGASVFVQFNACKFRFNHASQKISVPTAGGNISVIGGAIADSGTVPTTALSINNGTAFTIRDCDLSALTNNLVNMGNNFVNIDLQNCRLNASLTYTTGTNQGAYGAYLRVHNL